MVCQAALSLLARNLLLFCLRILCIVFFFFLTPSLHSQPPLLSQRNCFVILSLLTVLLGAISPISSLPSFLKFFYLA